MFRMRETILTLTWHTPCCPDLQDGAPAGTIFAEDIEDVREDYEESQKDSSKVNTFTHTLTNTLTPSQLKHVPSQQMHTPPPTPSHTHSHTAHSPHAASHTSPQAASHTSPHTHTTYLRHTQHTLTTHLPHLTTCPYHAPSSHSLVPTLTTHTSQTTHLTVHTISSPNLQYGFVFKILTKGRDYVFNAVSNAKRVRTYFWPLLHWLLPLVLLTLTWLKPCRTQ